MDHETKLLDLLREEGRPLLSDEIFARFEDRDAAAKAISRLLSSGRILMTRKKKLALPEQTGLVFGRIQGNSKGFGFFLPEDGSGDAFVSEDAMHGAMHGDLVWARIGETLSKNGAPEAEVALITERAYKRIVGTFEFDRYDAYIVPDDRKIAEDMLVLAPDTGGAKLGDKVVAEITAYPDGRRPMLGKVIEILGNRHDAGTDVLSVIRQYDLPETFSRAAQEQAQAVLPPSEEELARREDLRETLVITIDGADAKDLDDAVSLVEQEDGNLLLSVHIADVSHYVPAGSALDRDAKQRGTSVYLLDRVLPMLPKEISNGVCSLNAGEDKLALSCIMLVTPEGFVLEHRIAETVIRSRHRMTYADVNAMFAGDADLCEKYADVLPMLKRMDALREQLFSKRVRRGCIDFDLDEAEILLDEEGRPVDIHARARGNAERLIEEFMLLANETVAQYLFDLQQPCMYRVHEQPDREKMEDLSVFLETLGLGFKGAKEIRPKVLQKVLHQAKDTPEENIVGRVTLRSLKKARYSESCLGHFGLAAEFYCHFTSPIRRYPDLTVHRVLKLLLQGKLDAERSEALAEAMPAVAKHCSERERTAMEAERAVDDLKKCQYMQSRIGTVEEGIISGMAGFGFFVELENTVEGVVRLSSLTDDHYIWEEKQHRMVGRSTKRVYRLGDRITIRVTAANPDTRMVEFEVESPKKTRVLNDVRFADKTKHKPSKKEAKAPAKQGKGKGKGKGKPKGKH